MSALTLLVSILANILLRIELYASVSEKVPHSCLFSAKTKTDKVQPINPLRPIVRIYPYQCTVHTFQSATWRNSAVP